MTNFGLAMKQPYLSTMLDTNKGSVKNRTKCAGEHFLNATSTAVQTGAVIGGAYVLANKPELVTNAFNTAKTTVSPYITKFNNSRVGQKALELLGKAKSTDTGKKVADLVAKYTPKAKSAFAEFCTFVKEGATEIAGFAKAHPYVAAGAAVALTLIGLNHAFNAGKIDQKYNDKAQYLNA